MVDDEARNGKSKKYVKPSGGQITLNKMDYRQHCLKKVLVKIIFLKTLSPFLSVF